MSRAEAPFYRLSLVTRRLNLQYGGNSPIERDSGVGGEIMDELIGRLVADIGIDRAAAEKAVGIILEFLVKEGPADKVRPLLAKLPGAETLIQNAASEGGGDTTGGVMGAGMRMMSAGLSLGQVQSLARSVLAYAREKAGEDAVGEIVAAIPGLAQFV
jgi:hypothetical protein